MLITLQLGTLQGLRRVDSPQQAQAPTRKPGEGTGVVGQLGHDHLAAGRTAHLDRVVIKGDGLLHVDRLNSN
jgi:hypothetical protein